MNKKLTRRSILKSGFVAGAFVPVFGLLGTTAGAAALPALDPHDPTAAGLGFVTDASKVSASANPTFKAGQACGSCVQYQGKTNDRTAGCNIFPGHSVPANGWCKVWNAKSA